MTRHGQWVTVAAWLLALPIPTAGADGPTCLRGNCRDGIGTARIEGERFYRGAWTQGVRHGNGREWTPGGSNVWQGAYRSGALTGFASWVSSRDDLAGDYYVGSWANGRRHGYGVYTRADGTRYLGDHVDGYRKGRGTLLSPGGSRYEGEFAEDLLSGHGVLTIPGVLRYDGQWEGGARHGPGVEEYFDGVLRYEGEFEKDRPHWKGTVWMLGARLFEGEMDPKRGAGFGLVTRKDGSLYVGQLHDGIPEGRGAERDASGNVVTGTWERGNRVPTR